LFLRYESVNQTVQIGLRFLLGGEHGLQIGFRLFESILLGLLGRLAFGEQILDLIGRSIVIDGLLEGCLFRAGLAEESTATGIAAALSTTLSTALVTVAGAENGAHRIGIAGIAGGVQYLLHEGFHGVPIRVVGKAEFRLEGIHQALLHLGRIKVAAVTTLPATATTAAVAAATEPAVPTTAATAAVVLRI